MDPYKILGVTKDATIDEIKDAYREQAKKYHPDAGGDAWAFKQLQEAYEKLIDEKERGSPESESKSEGTAASSDASPEDKADDYGWAVMLIVVVIVYFAGWGIFDQWFGWTTFFRGACWVVCIGSGVMLAIGFFAQPENEQEKADYDAASQLFGAIEVVFLWGLIGIWRFNICVIGLGVAYIAYRCVSELQKNLQENSWRTAWLWFGAASSGMASLVLLYIGLVGLNRPAGNIPVQSLAKTSVVLEGSWAEQDMPATNPGFHWFGTAFVYERDDEVLRLYTNSHVLGLKDLATVAAAQSNKTANIGHYKLMLTFPSGKKRQVSRIGEVTGTSRDVARLEVSSKGLVQGEDYLIVPTVEDAISELDVKTGDEVIALGTPGDLELSGTQTFGNVGSVLTYSKDPEQAKWIQHDATITGGSSGGPLFLKQGDQAYWIGINSHRLIESSISFALSSDEAVKAEYKWANADAAGAANLVRSIHEVAAVVGRPVSPSSGIAFRPLPRQSVFGKDLVEDSQPVVHGRVGLIAWMLEFLGMKGKLKYILAIAVFICIRVMSSRKPHID